MRVLPRGVRRIQRGVQPLIGGTTAEDIRTGHVARLKDPAFPGRTTLMKVATVSTLWDYINRAMPWNAPKSLSTEEVYAVTAYLLNLGGVVPESFTLSDTNIAEVQRKLPNRNGMTTRHALWPGNEFGKSARPDVLATACMSNCGPEPRLRSALPEHASKQTTAIWPSRTGWSVPSAASLPMAAPARPLSLRPPGNRAARHRRPCWRRTPAWPAMA